MSLPRGLRNNNPGNIRRSNDDWQGLSPIQWDDEFFVFKNPFYGIRAMARTLINYERRHGITTLRDAIARYAPATENDTNAYVNFVSDDSGIPADRHISLAAVLPDIIPGMIHKEIGFQPFTDRFINRAIEAAK